MAELKAGIRLLAGHRVVLVVNGATGRKRYKGESAAAEEGAERSTSRARSASGTTS